MKSRKRQARNNLHKGGCDVAWPLHNHRLKEVLVRLVPAAVFKTVGLHGNHVVGGFDSHALPPNHLFFLTTPFAV